MRGMVSVGERRSQWTRGAGISRTEEVGLIRSQTPYATWLVKVLDLLDTPEMTTTPTFKTTFSSFILDIPLITSSTFERLSQMCQSKDK